MQKKRSKILQKLLSVLQIWVKFRQTVIYYITKCSLGDFVIVICGCFFISLLTTYTSYGIEKRQLMKKLMKKLEKLLELGGVKKDITLLVISGIALVLSLMNVLSLPFDISWVAIILCGVPIIFEAIIGLITEFDIKADVLVSLALVASVCIGEDFAAGEVAFIMQLGALLEDLTVAKARAGIEKLVSLLRKLQELF